MCAVHRRRAKTQRASPLRSDLRSNQTSFGTFAKPVDAIGRGGAARHACCAKRTAFWGSKHFGSRSLGGLEHVTWDRQSWRLEELSGRLTLQRALEAVGVETVAPQLV
jgi:hypothetical protein